MGVRSGFNLFKNRIKHRNSKIGHLSERTNREGSLAYVDRYEIVI